MSSRDFSTDIAAFQPSDVLVSFTKRLKKLLRKYLPDYNIKKKDISLEFILDSLESALSEISTKDSQAIQVKYKEANDFIQNTTHNLSKYEKLLAKKAKDFENQIKIWDKTKEYEEQFLNKEKEEITKLKNNLENEIRIEKEFITDQNKINSAMAQELKVFENNLLKEKLEKKTIQWNIDQKMRIIEEKESIFELKENMINQEKEELRKQLSDMENERMKNKLILEEYLKYKTCCNVSEWKSLIEYSPNNTKRPMTSVNFTSPERDLYEENSRMQIEKELSEIIQMKNSLENSKNELENIQDSILPELKKYYEILISSIEELKKLKEDTEKKINEFCNQVNNFQLKVHEVNELALLLPNQMKTLYEKEEELELIKNELDNEKKIISQKAEKINKDSEEFNNERLEFFNEISEERKRIEDYYIQIEEKLKKLHLAEQEIRNKYKKY